MRHFLAVSTKWISKIRPTHCHYQYLTHASSSQIHPRCTSNATPRYTSLHNITPHHTTPHHSILHSTPVYNTTPHHSILHSTPVYNTTPHHSILHSTPVYNTALHNTFSPGFAIMYNSPNLSQLTPAIPDPVSSASIAFNDDVRDSWEIPPGSARLSATWNSVELCW